MSALQSAQDDCSDPGRNEMARIGGSHAHHRWWILLAVVILYAGGWLLFALIAAVLPKGNSEVNRPIMHNPHHNRPPESPELREFRETHLGLCNMSGR